MSAQKGRKENFWILCGIIVKVKMTKGKIKSKGQCKKMA
jgi:translation initiation factor IF-1